jgi:diguanylate cyclase
LRAGAGLKAQQAAAESAAVNRSFAAAAMASSSSPPPLHLPRWLVLALIGLAVAASSVAATCALLLLRGQAGLGGEPLLLVMLVSVLVPAGVAMPLSAAIVLIMTRRDRASAALRPAAGGALSRDAFVQAATRHLDTNSAPASICLIAVDRLPPCVETRGLDAAAALRRAVAGACQAALRPADLLADWQDDELAALLAGVDAHEAVAVARRLQTMVQAVRLPHPHHGLRVSASIGVVCAGRGASTMGALLAQAEAAMLAARQPGHGGIRLVLPDAALAITSSE